jgi:hypothetical protein
MEPVDFLSVRLSVVLGSLLDTTHHPLWWLAWTDHTTPLLPSHTHSHSYSATNVAEALEVAEKVNYNHH